MNGLLLLNLGTPDEPTTGAVRRYLREFLSDPRVIDINPIGRFLLLNLFILPFRPRQSAEAYRKIWSERGSPLLYHGRDLADKVRARLGDEWRVELGMRYGEPPLADALRALRDAGADHVVVFPLFPQYASSSTGSALEVVYREAARAWNVPHLSVIDPFYDEPRFLAAVARVAAPRLEAFSPDHVLMSFHGLPERQIRKSDEAGDHCLTKEGCCDRIGPANRHCYRAQCFATARGLAAALGVAQEEYTVCFQSRLGRTVWIRPYTDVLLDQLAGEGIKRLAVLCPAFVADCLETLEEIGMRARGQFVAAGGEDLLLVPAVNSDDAWADAVAALARERIAPRAPAPGREPAAAGTGREASLPETATS